MRNGTIYVIKNKINEKIYIGQTTLSVKERWDSHKKPSTHKQRSSYKLYNAINKYGIDNFYYEILEANIPIEELDNKEIAYIENYDSFKNGYNSTKGGDGRIFNKIEDETDIINRVLNGETTVSIAKSLNVHYETVKRVLRKNNVNVADIIHIDDDLVIDLYCKNYTYEEICKTMNIDKRSIVRVLNRNNIKKKKPRFDYSSDILYDILNDIKSGVSHSGIMEKYNIGHHIFYNILNGNYDHKMKGGKV